MMCFDGEFGVRGYCFPSLFVEDWFRLSWGVLRAETEVKWEGRLRVGDGCGRSLDPFLTSETLE